jgi:hypothetical protein
MRRFSTLDVSQEALLKMSERRTCSELQPEISETRKPKNSRKQSESYRVVAFTIADLQSFRHLNSPRLGILICLVFLLTCCSSSIFLRSRVTFLISHDDA